MDFKKKYSFDDVLMVPKYSDFEPNSVDVSSFLTPDIKLAIPLVSAAMDTVTESSMAISLAQLGGIGCIHRNLTIEKQSEEVEKVKKHESWIVSNPVTIFADENVSSAIILQKKNHLSGIPVIDRGNNKLVGIITNRDVRFVGSEDAMVSDLMTSDLITVNNNITKKEALKLLHKYKIERLIVADKENRCIGLITVRDISKFDKYPFSSKDKNSRLIVAAAIGTDDFSMDRVNALRKAGADVFIIDTAHGDSKKVINLVVKLRSHFSDIQIIAGNVVTPSGAVALYKAGANGIKVGVGPGSICTTRIVCGIGVPQFSAVCDVASACKDYNVTIIADGGIRNSGDVAKSIGAGADTVMIGSLFAGTSESPGDVVLLQGRSYKSYRGMGSIPSMKIGSADRYFQSQDKFIAQGVEGLIPFKGKLNDVVTQLVGGLRCSMGYTGNSNLESMKTRAEFIEITNSGFSEGKPHDVKVTRDDSSL